ncbi:MAG: hypothetical protein K2K17_06815, partial [Lachnospiraceae bacterium]|nr:hypothetical protein [Lachnospiraceae bacterium]
MKKYLYILFTLILLLMICACGQEDVDDAQVSNAEIADHIDSVEETEPIQEELIQEAEANAPAEDESDMIQEAEMNAPAEVETVILPEEEKIVYEAYLAANAGHGYLYAYFDYDYDGKQELYLRSNTYNQVWKYADGGLKKIDGWTISGENILDLEWNEIEEDDSADTANSEEMVHEGVYVYVEQNPFKEQTAWYVEE